MSRHVRVNVTIRYDEDDLGFNLTDEELLYMAKEWYLEDNDYNLESLKAEFKDGTVAEYFAKVDSDTTLT